jgi:cytochrome oxidase Cu insertion factor (SCO1/SenC/PrrC family)
MSRAHDAWFFLALLLVGLVWSMPALTEETSEIDALFEEWQIMKLDEPLEAPGFSLTAMDGSTKTLEDFTGKLVFLNFWTTW